MHKYDPASVDTTGLELTEYDVDALNPQGEIEPDTPAPEGFIPDEDALEPGVNVDNLDGDA